MTETTPEEYRERRKRLSEALRSGEFTPARLNLRTRDNCYCVLGVICEQYRRETGIGEWMPVGSGFGFACSSTDYSSAGMPTAVKRYFGFQVHSASYTSPDGRMRSFLSDNDQGLSETPTLAAFADLVENPPEGLFKPETL